MRPDATSAIRAQLIAAMQRRAAGLDGQARHALDARLAELRAPEAEAAHEAPAAHANAPRLTPLRELAGHLARDVAERVDYPEVPALAEFRQLWATLRADSQLQQSVAHIPTDAGPLNSTALASRAIALMRELSPAYLRSFLAYVDDLAWLEQLSVAGSTSLTGTSAARKRARRKPTG
jgi:hypothetical protein